jgi:sec-independent protein translocase protein TatA
MEVSMMGFSVLHLLLFVVIVLLLFGGRGKISAVMGDFAKGIKSFKKGLAEEEGAANADAPPAPKPEAVENRAAGNSVETTDTREPTSGSQ